MTRTKQEEAKELTMLLALYRKRKLALAEHEVTSYRERLFSLSEPDNYLNLHSEEPSPSVKAIKLHGTDFDKAGVRNIWRIYPTQRLRNWAMRAFKQAYPELNYFVGWRDTQGWGLQCAKVDWAKNSDYVNFR